MMRCEPGSGTRPMTKATTKKTNNMPPVKKPRRRPPVDVAPLDSLLGFHVRLAMMELRRSFFRHVADGDVRPGLASLLQLVAANPGASQVELSRAMHIDKASLVSLIDRAEEAGWLNRVRSKIDRRRHELQLTAAGQRTAEKIRRQTTRHEKKYVDRFSATELEKLVDYLRRIYDD
jgi:DNA-binding MarR family transcriptional regulator